MSIYKHIPKRAGQMDYGTLDTDHAAQQISKKIISEWVAMADELRDAIHAGTFKWDGTPFNTFSEWLHSASALLNDDEAWYHPASDVCDSLGFSELPDEVHDDMMCGAIMWGITNYGITPAIDARLRDVVKDGTFDRDITCAAVTHIAQYQSERNRKPADKMSRTELLKQISTLDTEALRALVK